MDETYRATKLPEHAIDSNTSLPKFNYLSKHWMNKPKNNFINTPERATTMLMIVAPNAVCDTETLTKIFKGNEELAVKGAKIALAKYLNAEDGKHAFKATLETLNLTHSQPPVETIISIAQLMKDHVSRHYKDIKNENYLYLSIINTSMKLVNQYLENPTDCEHTEEIRLNAVYVATKYLDILRSNKSYNRFNHGAVSILNNHFTDQELHSVKNKLRDEYAFANNISIIDKHYGQLNKFIITHCKVNKYVDNHDLNN